VEPEEESDLELIARIDRGDERAFATLYDRHKRWVANLASRWTGDPDLALDVLQETFLYVTQKFPGFRLTARFRTFLYPVVRSLSITAFRKSRRYQSGELEQDQMMHVAAVEPAMERKDAVRAALASLSVEHRETLRLRFVDGFELREIAQAMDVPLGTVKSRLHHALAILRKDPRTRKFFEE
jgi:RNA polymerase sigma-70 factor (ECF subfamily)